MANLVTTTVVHASTRDGEKVRICRRSANTVLDHQVSDRSVTCGNCLRMIARVHAEALELHKAFLLGVAQAEVPAELLGRPEGLDTMADTLLSDEIQRARHRLALATNAAELIEYARRLTSLKLEREWRRAAREAELCRTDDHYDRFGEKNENVAGHVAAHQLHAHMVER